MSSLPHELRLLVLVVVNALTLGASVQFIRRRGTRDWAQVCADGLLVWYLVQYVSVLLPGAFGLLTPWAMMLVAALASVGLLCMPRTSVIGSERFVSMSDFDRRFALGCLSFLVAFILAIIWNWRTAPPLANDPLTYHLSAAARWLQTGSIGLHETWFFNPANTYSPLAGSVFIAWLMAPMGNDVIARGVEAPAMLLIFFAVLQLCRCLGASVPAAALIALAAGCSRPFISQTFLTKDDLFVAGFFAMAALSLARPRLTDNTAALRLGIALGLLLATKYTAMLSIPMLLLALDAPRRAGWLWKQHAVAIGIAAAIAGPWYVRNWIVAGNPIYPIDVLFAGMFTTQRSEAFASPSGVWATLVTSYSGMTIVPAIALIVLWIAAAVRAGRAILREPLARLSIVGPPVGFALFVGLSPYAEVRFVYPVFVLLFASCAIAAGWFRQPAIATAIAAALSIAAVGTSFTPINLRPLIEPAAWFLLIALALAVAIERVVFARRSGCRRAAMGVLSGALVALFALACATYVWFNKYVLDQRERADVFWSMNYGDLGRAWAFVRDELPPGEKIAYTNTSYTYPLMGDDLSRRVVYAPVRPGVRAIHDLGRLDARLTGEQIVDRVTALTTRQSDPDVWRENLRLSGAGAILIAIDPQKPDPPELSFAKNDPRFQPVFVSDRAIVYRIAR